MKIVIDPQYTSLRHHVEQLPGQFDRGELVYAARNVLRRFCWDGTVVVVKKYKVPLLINRFIYGGLRKSKAAGRLSMPTYWRQKGFARRHLSPISRCAGTDSSRRVIW